MPLVSVLPGLQKAQREHYALPCFDTVEMSGTQGIYEALEEARAPGLIGIWSGMLDRPYARSTVAAIRAKWPKAKIAIAGLFPEAEESEFLEQHPEVDYAFQ